MNIYADNRIVLTLDAGGTNFVFGAMRGGKAIVEPIGQPSNANDLDACLNGMVAGFEAVQALLPEPAEAISFAFPGPADYSNGIIGDLGNLPAFRGGIALGPMLQAKFGIPVFVQNDGDLYAYGESLGGIGQTINNTLADKGISKRYKNIVGLTLGTGFGAGFVHNGTLLTGDNSASLEIWNTSNSISPNRNAEEGVSTRAIINVYLEKAGIENADIMPFDIYKIAKGELAGNQQAAIDAFAEFGRHIGDAVANLIMLFDSNVVIGGGITGAADLYMPAVMETIRGKFADGQDRLGHKVFNLDSSQEADEFYNVPIKHIKVPGTDLVTDYFAEPRAAIATSQLGCSEAVALGAYAYALAQLDQG